MIESINEASVKDVQTKYYPNINIDVMNRLNQLSPDYNPSQPDRKTNYLPWVLNLYQKKDAVVTTSLEDDNMFNTLRNALIRFEQIKKDIPQEERDIRKYSGEGIERLVMVNYKNHLTQREQKEVIKKQSKILFNSSNWEIVSPLTWEASKFWGKNTRWCTASNKSSNFFDDYTSKGPLYINIDKINHKKWQFHFQSKSFFDEEDDNIPETYNDEYDSVAQAVDMPNEVIEWYKTNVTDDYFRYIVNNFNEWYGNGDNRFEGATYLFNSPIGTVYLMPNEGGGYYLVSNDYDEEIVYLSDSDDYESEPVWKNEEEEIAIIETSDRYDLVRSTYGDVIIEKDIEDFNTYDDINGIKVHTFIWSESSTEHYYFATLSNEKIEIKFDNDIEEYEQIYGPIFLLKTYDDDYDIVNVLNGKFYGQKCWFDDEDSNVDVTDYIYEENGSKYLYYKCSAWEGYWQPKQFRLNLNNPDNKAEFVKDIFPEYTVSEIKNQFWSTLNKLNEIKKRDLNNRID